MSSNKPTAAGGVLAMLQHVGKVIVFICSFGVLYPNVFDPGTEDNAAREAREERESGKKKA